MEHREWRVDGHRKRPIGFVVGVFETDRVPATEFGVDPDTHVHRFQPILVPQAKLWAAVDVITEEARILIVLDRRPTQGCNVVSLNPESPWRCGILLGGEVRRE